MPPCPSRSAGEDGTFATLDHDRPKSIGRLRGFHGNYGCFVRSYAYICSLGADGLKDASEVAVLNANYLLARLREHGVAEHLPLAYVRAWVRGARRADEEGVEEEKKEAPKG